ncbi:MAG: fructose-1,6-bisphosphatase [Cellulosilyticaceae bacterium]
MYSNECINLELLKFLAKQYPTIDAASIEIINLQAILNLPKATEHFVSDIHGEYEAFSHVLHNASGILKIKIDEVFKYELSQQERRSLAILLYYPKEKLEKIEQEEDDLSEWYKINLIRIIRLCKHISSKYTRSKVRKALPAQFAYIMEELLNEQIDAPNKDEYYHQIIQTIISLEKAKEFMCAFCYLIQRLAVDRLHVLGDIFDRGPRPDRVIERMMEYHSIDIQWGNHDILWMGAAAGSLACIANVIRISCRYANLQILEDGYGINLLPLATFALETYADTKTDLFIPKEIPPTKESEKNLITLMHKAITMIQFKLEGQAIERNCDFNMKSRQLLHLIDGNNQTISLEGTIYKMQDTTLPTLDASNPYDLTKEEAYVIERLRKSFVNSSKLQEHIRFLFAKGGMYKVYNDNLLYHGCMLMDKTGDFKEALFQGEVYKGKAYLDRIEQFIRDSFFNATEISEKEKAQDLMWYLWCGENSPLFGKNKMTTFERYFLAEAETHFEEKNGYYNKIDEKEMALKILREFGLKGPNSHIINGHVPVKVKKGESPIKAGGKILVIDGGFTKAYQKVTGIGGYTLIYDASGLVLASHEPFKGIEATLQSESDIVTTMNVIERVGMQKRVENTDIGREIKSQIEALTTLVVYYKLGKLKES